MNETHRSDPTVADYLPTVLPLIDRAFDAWDGDVAGLLGVPPGTFDLDAEADEPAER